MDKIINSDASPKREVDSFEELQGFYTGNSRQNKMQAPESRTA